MKKSVFGKKIKNVKSHRKIKLVTDIKGVRTNYQRITWFSGNLLAIEMSKTKLKIKGPFYLGLPNTRN